MSEWWRPFYNAETKYLFVRQSNLRRLPNGAPAELLEDLLAASLPPDVKILDVSHSGIYTLPPLPPTITHLCVGGNHLIKLMLHEGVQEVYCDSNPLDTLILPSTLQVLNCMGCPIYKLDSFPAGLKTFRAGHWTLHTLPPLPPALEMLELREIMTVEVKEFPASLKTIRMAGRSGLVPEARLLRKSLPALPDGLLSLTIHEMKLGTVPPFPPALQELVFFANNIQEDLPPFPDHLQRLDLLYNMFKKYPIIPAYLNENHAQKGYFRPV
jgi:large subunit ribosomal protein L30/E3 ubiquitin-protein ligase SspH2